MPTTTTYPNGQSLVSSALTLTQINAVFQPLLCGALGINPPDYTLVRDSWQTQGQPYTPRPTQDVCYFTCVPEDSDYAKIARDRMFTGTGPVTENWNYTRQWRIGFVLYGPNSLDHARQLHSAFFMDYFNDVLSLSNLYPLNDPFEPTRIPEQSNGEWWERADFHVLAYEAVVETIQDSIATSVEIKLETNDGLAADFTVVEP
jgi:hypothetical protein